MIGGIQETLEDWSEGSMWRTWVTHSIVWESFILGAVVLAFAVAIVWNPHPIWLVPVALLGDSAGSYFYANRERGDFMGALDRDDYLGAFDSVMDFVVPRVVTAFSWVVYGWLYFQVF